MQCVEVASAEALCVFVVFRAEGKKHPRSQTTEVLGACSECLFMSTRASRVPVRGIVASFNGAKKVTLSFVG